MMNDKVQVDLVTIIEDLVDVAQVHQWHWKKQQWITRLYRMHINEKNEKGVVGERNEKKIK